MLPASITKRIEDKMINGVQFEQALTESFNEENALIESLLNSERGDKVKDAMAHSVFIQIHTNQFNKKYA